MEVKKFYFSIASGVCGCAGSIFGKLMNYGEVSYIENNGKMCVFSLEKKYNEISRFNVARENVVQHMSRHLVVSRPFLRQSEYRRLKNIILRVN